MDANNKGGTEQWFVLRAIFKKEISVRDALRRSGLHCYVPLCYRVETQRGHRVRHLVPAITELVFVRGTEEAVKDAKALLRDTCYWLTHPVQGQERRQKVVVGDRDMENFIRVTEQTEADILYFRPDEVSLAKGDRIRIHGGAFDGVEGVLLKVKGRREKQLVVSIPDLAVAAVSVRPDVVEVITQQRSASRDILGDAKQLIRLATTMLSAPPDKETSRHEWNLLHREIQGLYQSLLPRKGIIPSTEGHLALALLLAERALVSVTEATLQRCHSAVIRLRPSKLRDQIQAELSGRGSKKF